MQKARCLVDENSVSFQMFLILLSSITLGSESQIPVFKEGQSNFAQFNFSRLSLALILKYYPILHAVKKSLD